MAATSLTTGLKMPNSVVTPVEMWPLIHAAILPNRRISEADLEVYEGEEVYVRVLESWLLSQMADVPPDVEEYAGRVGKIMIACTHSGPVREGHRTRH
jgi:hypothetical protein